MNSVDLMSPEKVAGMYGGDKTKIAAAARNGVISPTVAVMAGMFVDRMRGAAAKEMAPQTSVAEEVLPPAQQVAMAAPVVAPQMGEARGLEALPVDESMFPDEEGYAGGGIVAFQSGGETNPYREYTGLPGSRANILQFSPEEIAEQQRLKNAGLMDALGYMRRRFVDPVTEYLTRSPLETGGPRAREVAPAVAPAVAAAQAPYADEGTRGTAKDIISGAVPSRQFFPGDVGGMPPVVAPEARETAPAGGKAKPTTAPAESSEDYVKRMMDERKRALKEAGVSDDPFAQDRAEIERMRGQVEKDKEKAGAMALIEAGLGIAGGKSRYALQNLAEAKGAITNYAKAIRDIKADEKEYAKIDRDLNKAEDALKRGDVDAAFKLRESAEDRAIRLRGVEAQEKAAFRPSTFSEVTAALRSKDPEVRRAAEAYLGASKMGTVTDKVLIEQWGKLRPLEKMQLKKQGINSLEDYIAYQRSALGGAGASAAPTGRVIDFSSIK